MANDDVRGARLSDREYLAVPSTDREYIAVPSTNAKSTAKLLMGVHLEYLSSQLLPVTVRDEAV